MSTFPQPKDVYPTPTLQPGDRLPSAEVFVERDGGWAKVHSDELFEGRTVVLFALPGAFTPTCSTAHVPRYDELAPALKAAGVDEIYCLSVNDRFVMEAWKEDQQAKNITFVADGNGELSAALGMLVDKGSLGFGPRSWRYSMLVRDGKLEKLFVEPSVPGDPYEVSDADTMLRAVSPDAELPPDILLVTKPGCPHCARARRALEARGLTWGEIPATPRTLRAISDTHTTPRVFIDGELIGGADDLEAWLSARQAA